MLSWLEPIEIAITYILVGCHDLLTRLGMPGDSGWTWVLSIFGLVVVIRTLLIPLFVYQIKAGRRMQLMQPHMQKIQAKYKNKKDPASRRQQQAEIAELYRDHGNPFASCLPLLAQMPIFFALFQTLNSVSQIADGSHKPLGMMTPEVATQMVNSSFLGAQLSESFLRSDSMGTKIVAAVLVVLMTASQFYSMRQMMTMNTSEAAMNNPMMQNQKIMLYILPPVFGITGFGFPVGVVLYWFASNIWTVVQQILVLRTMPAPGSEAEKQLNARRAKKGLPPVDNTLRKKDGTATPKVKDTKSEDSDDDQTPEQVDGRQRHQPKRSSRRSRR